MNDSVYCQSIDCRSLNQKVNVQVHDITLAGRYGDAPSGLPCGEVFSRGCGLLVGWYLGHEAIITTADAG